jgi:hypothetical protein
VFDAELARAMERIAAPLWNALERETREARNFITPEERKADRAALYRDWVY